MIDHNHIQHLIDNIRAGRRNDFAELVRIFQDKVYGLSLSILKNPLEAEEAAQEIFIKAFKGLPQFRSDSSFSTWLYSISTRHCLDLIRQNKRRAHPSFDEMMEEQGEKNPGFLPSPPGPAETLENRDLVETLLREIPPQYAEILILREIQGLSYEELASALSCSLDAVKARLRRARREVLDRSRHIFKEETV